MAKPQASPPWPTSCTPACSWPCCSWPRPCPWNRSEGSSSTWTRASCVCRAPSARATAATATAASAWPAAPRRRPSSRGAPGRASMGCTTSVPVRAACPVTPTCPSWVPSPTATSASAKTLRTPSSRDEGEDPPNAPPPRAFPLPRDASTCLCCPEESVRVKSIFC